MYLITMYEIMVEAGPLDALTLNIESDKSLARQTHNEF